MKYRKLRISWSVAWGVLAVLLVVLWVRSYWWLNSWLRTAPRSGLYIQLFEGEVKLMRIPRLYPNSQVNTWYFGTLSAKPIHQVLADLPADFHVQYMVVIGPIGPNPPSVRFSPSRITIVPVWSIPLVAATLAAVPWLPWRFSLRTLLIGMTVAAIGLGCIVYALRK